MPFELGDDATPARLCKGEAAGRADKAEKHRGARQAAGVISLGRPQAGVQTRRIRHDDAPAIDFNQPVVSQFVQHARKVFLRQVEPGSNGAFVRRQTDFDAPVGCISLRIAHFSEQVADDALPPGTQGINLQILDQAMQPQRQAGNQALAEIRRVTHFLKNRVLGDEQQTAFRQSLGHEHIRLLHEHHGLTEALPRADDLDHFLVARC